MGFGCKVRVFFSELGLGRRVVGNVLVLGRFGRGKGGRRVLFDCSRSASRFLIRKCCWIFRRTFGRVR